MESPVRNETVGWSNVDAEAFVKVDAVILRIQANVLEQCADYLAIACLDDKYPDVELANLMKERIDALLWSVGLRMGLDHEVIIEMGDRVWQRKNAER